MTNDDIDEFITTWESSLDVYGSKLTDGALAIVFKVLEPFDLGDIKKALALHLAENKFSPKPADIIELINRSNPDGHPGADEAWAIAIEMMSEDATVITTEQINTACPNATKIYNDGDSVGARMAFRQAYEPLVKAAREEGVPAIWFPSLGHDSGQRKSVIMGGIQQGILGTGFATAIQHLLDGNELEQLDVLRLERNPPIELLESDDEDDDK